MARETNPPGTGVSKTRLLLGAGALFLFIVGVRKSWQRPDDSGPTQERPDDRPRGYESDRD